MLVRHRAAIMKVVCAMLPDYGKAEDIFQDLAATVARHRDRYDETRDFLPWAKGVARNLVRRHYEKGKRSRVAFIEDLERLSTILDDMEDEDPNWERKRSALQVCIDKLSSKNKQLIMAKYRWNLEGSELARKFGGTVGSVRVILHRIRASLKTCILQCLSVAEHTGFQES